MPQEEYQNLTAIVITIFVFLLIGFFIVILVAYFNQRKKKHFEEKRAMQLHFKQELLQSQLEIQEQTFNQISQEIHDNVGQVLSLAKVQIHIMTESDNLNRAMLFEVKENVGKALGDLRDIAKSLSTERLRTVSIITAIASEAERINKSGVSKVELTVVGVERAVEEQKKLILFRIIQDGLQNAIKHAGASQIEIMLNYGIEVLEISIRDNGHGFDPTLTTHDGNGLGLLHIKTRAMLAGGASSLESRPGGGTQIKITMPYA